MFDRVAIFKYFIKYFSTELIIISAKRIFFI